MILVGVGKSAQGVESLKHATQKNFQSFEFACGGLCAYTLSPKVLVHHAQAPSVHCFTEDIDSQQRQKRSTEGASR